MKLFHYRILKRNLVLWRNTRQLVENDTRSLSFRLCVFTNVTQDSKEIRSDFRLSLNDACSFIISLYACYNLLLLRCVSAD